MRLASPAAAPLTVVDSRSEGPSTEVFGFESINTAYTPAPYVAPTLQRPHNSVSSPSANLGARIPRASEVSVNSMASEGGQKVRDGFFLFLMVIYFVTYDWF